MNISILSDTDDRVVALCMDDLTGNTGWNRVDDSRITDHTGKTLSEIYDNLSNDKGVPLYKFVDGYVENRTPEEIAADEAAIPVDDSVSPDVAISELLEVLNDDT